MKQRDILFLSISVFALIAFWVGFNINHNLASSTISAPIKENIVPISPNFDTKTVEVIKNRRSVEPLFQSEIASTSSLENIPDSLQSLSQESSSSGEVGQ